MRRHEPKQRCKRERSRTVRVFMVSYALAFAVLCGFAFLAVAALRPQEKPELVQEPSAYLPEAGDERTLLVLFVGEDLDVLLSLCDRILVIGSGRITGLLDARTATKEQIGALMAAAKPEAEQTAHREGSDGE